MHLIYMDQQVDQPNIARNSMQTQLAYVGYQVKDQSKV